MVAANLASLFARDKIILAGEVSNGRAILWWTMERLFRELTLPRVLWTAYLEDGSLGGVAGALEAAWLGFSGR